MDWMKAAALVILLLMYVVMIGFSKWKVYAVAAAALLYLILGILPFSVIPSAINWNVLMMMAGTMILVDYFIVSKMPNRIAEILLDKSTNVMWVTIYMSLFAGVISAFIIVCLRVGLGQKNVNAQVILLILGVLLIAAVALPNIIGNIRNSLKKKAA